MAKDKPPTHVSPQAGEYSERNVLLITYVLYALGSLILLPTIAGVVINHIKIRELAPASVNWTHHRWLMRTFWFGLFWNFICLILTPIIIGLVGYAILWIWFLYRFIRGLLRFAHYQPMPY